MPNFPNNSRKVYLEERNKELCHEAIKIMMNDISGILGWHGMSTLSVDVNRHTNLKITYVVRLEHEFTGNTIIYDCNDNVFILCSIVEYLSHHE